MERFICIHGHFYQPPRENPWLEAVEIQDSASPYHDWNERVTAECYAPNSASRILNGERRITEIVSNYAKISFNLGPTLLSWMEKSAPEILFDNSFYLKLYRRMEGGVNPETEMGRFLTENVRYDGVALFVGTLEYRRAAAGTVTIALLQGYIPGQGDARSFSLNEVTSFFDRVLAKPEEAQGTPPLPPSLFDMDFAAIPPLMQELIGGFYLEMAALLGRRTGELHLALASRPAEPDFSPDPFSILYQRSVYQSVRSIARKVLGRLGRNLKRLPPEIRQDAETRRSMNWAMSWTTARIGSLSLFGGYEGF